ncbi:unnamed protein product [Amoebophrya sp. A120]|nr:unnamed protein product [Amoebophrya sp. A120]|eukprot:GSA120T00002815001.1
MKDCNAKEFGNPNYRMYFLKLHPPHPFVCSGYLCGDDESVGTCCEKSCQRPSSQNDYFGYNLGSGKAVGTLSDWKEVIGDARPGDSHKDENAGEGRTSSLLQCDSTTHIGTAYYRCTSADEELALTGCRQKCSATALNCQTEHSRTQKPYFDPETTVCFSNRCDATRQADVEACCVPKCRDAFFGSGSTCPGPSEGFVEGGNRSAADFCSPDCTAAQETVSCCTRRKVCPHIHRVTPDPLAIFTSDGNLAAYFGDVNEHGVVATESELNCKHEDVWLSGQYAVSGTFSTEQRLRFCAGSGECDPGTASAPLDVVECCERYESHDGWFCDSFNTPRFYASEEAAKRACDIGFWDTENEEVATTLCYGYQYDGNFFNSELRETYEKDSAGLGLDAEQVFEVYGMWSLLLPPIEQVGDSAVIEKDGKEYFAYQLAADNSNIEKSKSSYRRHSSHGMKPNCAEVSSSSTTSSTEKYNATSISAGANRVLLKNSRVPATTEDSLVTVNSQFLNVERLAALFPLEDEVGGKLAGLSEVTIRMLMHSSEVQDLEKEQQEAASLENEESTSAAATSATSSFATLFGSALQEHDGSLSDEDHLHTRRRKAASHHRNELKEVGSHGRKERNSRRSSAGGGTGLGQQYKAIKNDTTFGVKVQRAIESSFNRYLVESGRSFDVIEGSTFTGGEDGVSSAASNATEDADSGGARLSSSLIRKEEGGHAINTNKRVQQEGAHTNSLGSQVRNHKQMTALHLDLTEQQQQQLRNTQRIEQAMDGTTTAIDRLSVLGGKVASADEEGGNPFNFSAYFLGAMPTAGTEAANKFQNNTELDEIITKAIQRHILKKYHNATKNTTTLRLDGISVQLRREVTFLGIADAKAAAGGADSPAASSLLFVQDREHQQQLGALMSAELDKELDLEMATFLAAARRSKLHLSPTFQLFHARKMEKILIAKQRKRLAEENRKREARRRDLVVESMRKMKKKQQLSSAGEKNNKGLHKYAAKTGTGAQGGDRAVSSGARGASAETKPTEKLVTPRFSFFALLERRSQTLLKKEAAEKNATKSGPPFTLWCDLQPSALDEIDSWINPCLVLFEYPGSIGFVGLIISFVITCLIVCRHYLLCRQRKRPADPALVLLEGVGHEDALLAGESAAPDPAGALKKKQKKTKKMEKEKAESKVAGMKLGMTTGGGSYTVQRSPALPGGGGRQPANKALSAAASGGFAGASAGFGAAVSGSAAFGAPKATRGFGKY